MVKSGYLTYAVLHIPIMVSPMLNFYAQFLYHLCDAFPSNVSLSKFCLFLDFL